MASRLDLILTLGLYQRLGAAEVVQKLGKRQVAYASVYGILQKLKAEGYVNSENEKFYLTKKSEKLFKLVYFCFSNDIDYNKVISEKTAEFVKIGLENGIIEGLPFDTKTVKRIVDVLSKHGFAAVESRKPFSCRIVHSAFLERLVENFFGRPEVKCPELAECVDESKVDSRLEREFSAYKKLSKEKAHFDEIGFIHSSLSLEGNTLTLPETERLIKENIPPTSKPFKDAQQVLDYKKALDSFIYSDKKITEEEILEFHRTAMNSLQAGAGKFRLQNVQIRGNPDFKLPDWHELPVLLKNFFEEANRGNGKKVSASAIIGEAAFLHNEFQRIHPFVDGNSRTARAIFIKMLIQNGFPLVKIPVGFSGQYMKLTKLSRKRDDKKFSLLMKIIVLENLKAAAKKLEYA